MGRSSANLKANDRADFSPRELAWMQRALALAARGQGRVEPNPMVGCVIVRNGRIVGEGYHRRFGGPHAEINALQAAGSAARGATTYVTLEPCCHVGKTPPCTDALLAAGVKRVVAAMRDPFPKVSGHGLEILEKAGVHVEVGLCEQEACRLNGPYLKRQRLGLPWVILKWAQSLDGKIATRTGDSKWISDEPSRKWVHRLRARVDAVVVGVGTVLADDPQLTCRHGRVLRTAMRIVLDPHLRIPMRAKLVRTARETPTMVVTTPTLAASSHGQRLQRAGVQMMEARLTRGGELDLRDLLKQWAQAGMSNVLVEGGGQTLGRFLDAGLADEAIVFVSHRLIGGEKAISAVGGIGPSKMSDICHPWQVCVKRSGNDDRYQLAFTDPAMWVKEPRS